MIYLVFIYYYFNTVEINIVIFIESEIWEKEVEGGKEFLDVIIKIFYIV